MRGLTITALNAAARREGLSTGLGLADARARIPDLLSEPAMPERDSEALLALAYWCGRYSPTLNVDGTDGLWIDVTGVAHLFGGEAAMLHDIETRLRGLGFRAYIGIADTLAAAWALARFQGHPQARPGEQTKRRGGPKVRLGEQTKGRGGPKVRPGRQTKGRGGSKVRPGRQTKGRGGPKVRPGEDTSLHSLPVEGLRLSADTITLLKRLGLTCIGQLVDLPRANLQSRFRSREAADAVLLRLDQALGVRSEPRTPLVSPTIHGARLAFSEPLISNEAFEGALHKLTNDLCQSLAGDQRGARSILFTAYRSDGTCVRIDAGLSAPSRKPAHLMRLLIEKVSTIDAGFGIDCLTLVATSSETLRANQESLAQDVYAKSPGPLIDRLANRLASARVIRPVPCESHIPERAERHTPALQSQSRPEPMPGTPGTAIRPPFLFVPPEPIAVMAEIPEGPPAHFTWRRVRHRIRKAEGPERITPEWWREIGTDPSRPRDYYRVEDEDGRRYWVFRDGLYDGGSEETLPEWYLHGVFG